MMDFSEDPELATVKMIKLLGHELRLVRGQLAGTNQVRYPSNLQDISRRNLTRNIYMEALA
jgi:hypothetical protein